MKVYYSNMTSVKGLETVLPKDYRIGVLVSYYGLRAVEPPPFCDLYFLDSGAFSAFRKKDVLDPEAYAAFIEAYASKIHVYANLDVIGDAEASLKNQLLLEKWGLMPLPCYHAGEPLEYLERYVKEYDYLALGGLVSMGNDQEALNRWLEICFDYITKWAGRTPAKVHGFGIQSPRIMERFPWYSVDASSTHMQARYGGVRTPWGWAKINPDVNGKESSWMTMTPTKLEKVREWATEFCPFVDFEAARANTTDGTLLRCAFNIWVFEKLAEKTLPYGYTPMKKGRLLY